MLIKQYLNAIIAVVILAAVGYVYWLQQDRNSIRAEYAHYKEVIHDQVQQAAAEAEAAKREQRDILNRAQRHYRDTSHNLDIALERLRDTPALLRKDPLRVSGCGTDSMPAEAGDTTRTHATFATRPGTCDLEFYADAMRDAAQCRALIDFVR